MTRCASKEKGATQARRPQVAGLTKDCWEATLVFRNLRVRGEPGTVCAYSMSLGPCEVGKKICQIGSTLPMRFPPVIPTRCNINLATLR